MIPDYVVALTSEMRRFIPESRRLRSIFFGGGTPSYLPSKYLVELLAFIKKNFITQPETEITIEINPGTVGRAELRFLKKAGFNRLSIGIQAAQNFLLKEIGRIHTWEEFLSVYKAARETGFTNTGVDLIFGLPGQSLADWRYTLMEVIRLQPEHISAYGLQLEEGTRLYAMVNSGAVVLPPEDEVIAMMRLSMKLLREYGYEHYEISNYAKPGFASVHNLGYWTGRDYLGFGAGAYTTNHGKRWYNEKDPARYVESLRKNQLIISECETITRRLATFEAVMLGLRLRAGINLASFATQYGVNLREKAGSKIAGLLDQDLLVLEDGYLKLTDQAVVLSNHVISRLLDCF